MKMDACQYQLPVQVLPTLCPFCAIYDTVAIPSCSQLVGPSSKIQESSSSTPMYNAVPTYGECNGLLLLIRSL